MEPSAHHDLPSSRTRKNRNELPPALLGLPAFLRFGCDRGRAGSLHAVRPKNPVQVEAITLGGAHVVHHSKFRGPMSQIYHVLSNYDPAEPTRSATAQPPAAD